MWKQRGQLVKLNSKGKKVPYADTNMKTAVTAQSKYPNILENAPSSGQAHSGCF